MNHPPSPTRSRAETMGEMRMMFLELPGIGTRLNVSRTRLGASVLRAIVFGVPLIVIGMSACKPDAPSASVQPYSAHEARLDQADTPAPPDLRLCTRVELRYLPSTIDYFFSSSRDLRLLNEGEIAYLRSLESISIEDRTRLDALAADVGRLIYDRRITGFPRIYEGIEVTCYRGTERMPAFITRWDDLLTASGDHFLTKGNGLPSIMRNPVPDVRPFARRVECAHNLWFLYHGIWSRTRDNRGYPRPTQWCDDLRQSYSRSYSDTEIMSRFACPGAKAGTCHYAMNPLCTPESSADTVLLFETTAGWNQHGGPELFAFDHHDPVGGCVLLNDGDREPLSYATVLFIRTRQELEQLRWE